MAHHVLGGSRWSDEMSDRADPPKSLRLKPVAGMTTVRMPSARPAGIPQPKEAKASRLVRYPNASNALRSLLEEGVVKEHRLEFKTRVDPKLAPRGRVVEKLSPSERSKPSPNALRIIRESLERPVRDYQSTYLSPPPPLPRMEAVQIMEGAHLGQIVRIRRQMLNLSQQQLADRVGVGRRFIGDLEGGKPSVELGKALAVCRTLGLTVMLQAADGR